MILYSIECDVCGRDFRIPVADVRDKRNTHCIHCGKLVTIRDEDLMSQKKEISNVVR